MRDLFFLVLAAYKLTKLISKEAGPYRIFSNFRKWIGIELIKEITTEGFVIEEEVPTNEFAAMIHCPLCLSGWITLLFLNLDFKKFYLWFGVWGIVDLLFTITSDRSD